MLDLIDLNCRLAWITLWPITQFGAITQKCHSSQHKSIHPDWPELEIDLKYVCVYLHNPQIRLGLVLFMSKSKLLCQFTIWSIRRLFHCMLIKWANCTKIWLKNIYGRSDFQVNPQFRLTKGKPWCKTIFT